MNTYERAKNVLAKMPGYETEEIKPESHLWDDLGFDSLTMIDYAMALEDEFNIPMDDNEEYERMTVQDIVEIIEAKRKLAA